MKFILRPWKTSDTESLVRYANNTRIASFMTDQFPHPYTNDKALSFIRNAMMHKPVQIFAIEVEGEAAGGIGLHPQNDIQRKNAELGYWLAEKHWNKGIVTNAVKEMIEYGFSKFDINRIFARPFGNNIASQKVLEKAGFRLEARIEKGFYKNGEYLDELIYAIRKN
jgi:[ribosomal protein S5]-alanine N-acetyltransferase